MSETGRHAFWLQCQELKGEAKADLARKVKRKEVQNEMDSFAEGGEFLPLGVWKTKGFDVDRIAANTTADNKFDDLVLGLCYRVVIKSKHFKKTHGTAFEDENIFQPGAASADARSSNSDDPQILAEQIQNQMNKVKELKEKEKTLLEARKKLSKLVNAQIASMRALASKLKVDKMPQSLMGANNPLLPVQKEHEDLLVEVTSCQESGLDAMAAKIAKATEQAKLVQRAMKPFA